MKKHGHKFPVGKGTSGSPKHPTGSMVPGANPSQPSGKNASKRHQKMKPTG